MMAEMTLHYDQGVSDPGGGSPMGRALVTFLSFLALGSIPILPFMLREVAEKARAIITVEDNTVVGGFGSSGRG